METIFTEKHMLRNSRTELCGGLLVEPFERPSRAQDILARVLETGLGPVSPPEDFGLDPILAVHDAGYIAFLQSAWRDWTAAGFEGEAMATVWPARRMSTRIPSHIEGRLGYYAMACETSISDGTWEAAYAAAQVALTGAERLNSGARAAFSLCRPPGHHAAIDMYGGYCFINNAAVAAQHLLDTGARRVAILDVDFHHGNGTQDIFDSRDDVLTLFVMEGGYDIAEIGVNTVNVLQGFEAAL